MFLRIASFLFLAVSLLPGQVVPGRYIVELAGEPAGKSARKAVVQTQQRRARAALAQRGVEVLDSVETVANALFVRATSEQAAALAALPDVALVEPVRLAKALLDHAILLQGVTDAWALTGGSEKAGAGIKIGILDTGIDAQHPAFQDSTLPALDGYPKVSAESDLKYTNQKIIVARAYPAASDNSALDIKGHGTSVAMIAAGVRNNGPRGPITGIAPKAYLGNYKVFPDNEERAPTDGILKALDDAVADGMDIINLSLGIFPAPRPAEDSLARAVERAMAAGVLVVVATGNEGPGSSTIGSPATALSAISVGNANNDRVFGALAKLEGTEGFIAEPGSGANSAVPITAPVFDVMNLDPTGLACAALPEGSLGGAIALVLRGECDFEEKLKIARAAGAVAALIYARPESPEPIPMAVGSSTLPAMMISNEDGTTIRARLHDGGTIPATLDFSLTSRARNQWKISGTSSRGPSADLTLKPELLAVGNPVYTAAPSSARGPGYSIGSGTSLSAPMVAGAAAVLKAGRPGLTAVQYRSLLINSATRFSIDGNGVPAPVQQAGAGLLNAASALRSTISVVPSALSFGTTSGTINSFKTVSLTNLASTVDTLSISVERLGAGTAPTVSTETVQLGPGESQNVTVQMLGTNLSAGEHSGFLVVRSSQSSAEARVPYWFGVPSDQGSTIFTLLPNSPSGRKTASTELFLLRTLDRFGMPLQAEPTITVVSGGGSVQAKESIDSILPGFYGVEVKLGEEPGANIFQIDAAGATTRLVITAN